MIGVRLERGREAVGRNARRFDRLLHLHAEQVDVEEDLQHRLGLHVAAGRAERHFHLARLNGDRRARRESRPLAGGHARRMIGVAPVLAAARRRNDAQLRHHRCVVRSVARRRREHVAMPVDDTDVRRVDLRRHEGPLGYRRRSTRRALGHHFAWIAGWRHFGPGPIRADHVAPLPRVVG